MRKWTDWDNTESSYEVEVCAVCEQQTYLVNRTHKLCSNCNCVRLHGITLIEKQKQAQKAMRERQLRRSVDKAKNTPQGEKRHVPKIRQVSEKQKKEIAELTRLKQQLKDVAEKSGKIQCKGCLKWFNRSEIDMSHKASVGSRCDLKKDPNNLTMLCHRECHDIWENGKIEQKIKLHCFESEMKYLYEKDYSKFAKILDLLIDYSQRSIEAERILKRIEQFENV